MDTTTSVKPTTFTVCNNPIHTLIAAPYDSSLPSPTFLAAADSDRYIYVLDTTSGKIRGSLIASGDVKALAFAEIAAQDETDLPKRTILAAVTEQGEVGFFPSPFTFQDASKPKAPASLKSARSSKTRTATATIKIKNVEKAASAVPILGASFEENEVVFAWAEGGMSLRFERITWRNHTTGEILLEGPIEIVKAKSSAGLGVTSTNGVKHMGRSYVDESHAIVARGGDADDAMILDQVPDIIDISSAEEESESDEEHDRDRRTLPEPRSPNNEAVNGMVMTNGDVHMEDITDEGAADTGDTEEPTFGDLIRANAPDVVDVSVAFSDPTRQALAAVKDGARKLPVGISLGAVLTQSLRANDLSLLETCFHVHDLNIVRATIERLDSALAANLLQKLAERLHGRPGRAGSLMVWVQWTLVAHGGYLASQPEVVKKLTSLHRVVKERANSLQSLLSLKGKLDMLEAQMNLRKSMQSRFGIRDAEDEDDEEGVIYVEGQDESSSEKGQEDILAGSSAQSKTTIQKEESLDIDDASSETDEDTDSMPPNIEDGSMESDDSEDGSDVDGLIDDEASDTDDDEGLEDEVDHDDVDSADEDDESEIEALNPKASKPKLSNGLTPRR